VGRAEALAGRILEQPDLDHLARRWATWTVVNGGPFSGRTESVRVVAEAEINRMGVGGALALVPFELMLPYCYSLCRSGRLDEARSVTEDCYRSALALHDPAGVSIARWLHGVALMDSGHLAEARSAYRDSADAMGRDDPGPYRVVVLSELSRACVSLGDVEGSRAALDVIAELPGYPPLFDLLVARARAWHLACTGETDAAVVEATRAAESAGRLGQGAQEAAQLHDVARMGRAALVTDRLTELARTYEGALMATYAVHARALALHAAPDLEAAARQFAVLGADLLSAEAWVEAAVAHGRSSDRSAERRCQARAAEALAPCGPARTPALTLPLRRAGLTRREVEIASMAASGLSDREIARRCELSLRTVENHLHRAYSKLGINSRSLLGEALERRRTGGISFRD